MRATQKVWHARNREKANAVSKAWRESNPERNREHKRKWNKEKYHTDPVFRLKSVIRARLNKCLRSSKKVGSPIRDLGCSVEGLISHVEFNFAPGMSWDTHGSLWEVDHIKPLAGFDLTDRKQFLEACHYTNLQPLWIADHKEKTRLECFRQD